MIKLSILIPAYNIERWLSRCLDSILSQIFEGVEVIIVDDGSTDDTLHCAYNYAEKWDCIRVFTKKNEGVGVARNFLLDKAQGEYVWFVDSDDYIIAGSLQYILSECVEPIDLLGISYNNVLLPAFVGTGIEYIQHGYINGYLWTKIIRRSIIENTHIRFDPQRYSQEDWFFLMQVYPLVSVAKQVSRKVYVYCDDNDNSIMRGIHIENTKRNVIDSRETICNFKKFVDIHNDKSFYKVYEQWMNYSLAGYLYSLFPIDYSINEIKNDIKIFRNRGLYPVGRTGRRKANLFLMIANKECCYLLLISLYRKCQYIIQHLFVNMNKYFNI